MDRQRRDSPEIPSFFQALRCTCGKARSGPFCDGSHLSHSTGQDCNEPSNPNLDPAPENRKGQQRSR